MANRFGIGAFLVAVVACSVPLFAHHGADSYARP